MQARTLTLSGGTRTATAGTAGAGGSGGGGTTGGNGSAGATFRDGNLFTITGDPFS
jgi:hypothetical protein